MIVHTPESGGMSAERLRRLDQAIARRMEAGELAGAAACVARMGRVVHFRAQGMADRERGVPIAEDTIYRMYSMTKPVTAAALLTLLEEGRFQLDDPASAFIPELGSLKVLSRVTPDGPQVEELRRPVTFRHLLTHTAGFCYPNAGGSGAEKLLAASFPTDATAEFAMDLDQAVKTLCGVPLAHQPGEGWTYGLSIDVVGRLIEVIAGRPLDLFLQERIFGPLAMRDTGFSIPEEKRGRAAIVYGKGPGGTLDRVAWATDVYFKKPLFLSGGGGLVSTAEDYLRFALMLLNGGELDGQRVLGRRTVKLMMQNHVPQIMGLPSVSSGDAFGLGYGYGLGGRVMLEEYAGLFGSVGTYGWSGMACTDFLVDPKEGIVALFLAQAIPWPPSIMEQFRTLVYQALV
jgi:CubicO group peptidase (beta-lactamase class C family)